MKTCAISQCRAQIKNELLMCSHHWRRVTSPTQSKVYAAARKYSKCDPRAMSKEAFFKLRDEYYGTVQEAVAEVSIEDNDLL